MSAAEPYLQVSVEEAAGAPLVVARGEVDAATAATLAEHLDHAAASSAEAISVDLSGVTFIDSSGLRVITVARAQAEAEGRLLVVTEASEAVRRIFAMTGLTALLGA